MAEITASMSAPAASSGAAFSTPMPPMAQTGRFVAARAADRIAASPRPACGFEGEAKKPLGIESMREAGKGLSIAVVDDDFIVHEIVKNTFGPSGSTVLTFDDGADCQ